MVKSILEGDYDISRFTISTTVTKKEDGYSCKGRAVQSRGVNQEDGEIKWEDKAIESEAIGEHPEKIESIVLENLFSYLANRDFYLFEDTVDGNKDDIQEV